MYFGYGYDYVYVLIVVISLVLGGAAQFYINSTYNRWSKVASKAGKTGAQVAKDMLASQGASEVQIGHVAGHLSDYYDPRDNSLHLSNENYQNASVASICVACHEAGHAIQRKKGYVPSKFREALVPVVNFTQQAWGILFFLGFFMNIAGLTQLAIICFAFSVLFQIVTLPVEIDASRRAVAYLSQAGDAVDAKGAKQVLTAAALTYVAAALVSVLQLVYLLSRTRND